MMARGLGPDTIAAELGTSRATAARRMKELRAGVPEVRAARRAAASRPARVGALPAAPATPSKAQSSSSPVVLPDADTVPEATPLEQINEWLKMAKEEAEVARTGDDLDTVQKMTRLAATLLTLQQKYTRPPPPDVNEHPDFVAAAARVRKRWHELLSKISKSPEKRES